MQLLFLFDNRTKTYFKSQRHRASLKRIRSGLDLLYIFRNILIFILMSYGIDKNCTFDILKELLRYYRKTLLFFKRLVINKDLLPIRILCRILKNFAKANFEISLFGIFLHLVSYGSVVRKFWDKISVRLEIKFFRVKSFFGNEFYLTW